MKLVLLFLLALVGPLLAIADVLSHATAMEPAFANHAHAPRLLRLPSTDALAPTHPRPASTADDIHWGLPASWEEPPIDPTYFEEGGETPPFLAPYGSPTPLNQLDDQAGLGYSRSVIPLGVPRSWQDQFNVDALARAYYLNDQRVEWSGMEATFGAEAAVRPQYHYQAGEWEGGVVGDFYLNQPFDRNRYINSPERRSYQSNFQPNLFQISNLYLSMQNENWYFAAGKIETPFGRTYFPLYSNSRIDAPFIRTESIRWRDTGLLGRYHRNHWVCDVALTNGGVDQDTNSSKALITRLGMDFENFSFGFSYKTQDGIGSEEQKTYNNHVGTDFMARFGRFRLSGEAIYDEYGFRRPGYNPDEIFWDRSIYYRDVNKGFHIPCQGYGYYLNLDYLGERWTTTLNFGEYYPDQLGIPRQDQVNRRGLLKASYRVNRVLQSYTVGLIENGGYIAQDNRKRVGFMILSGFQANF